MHLLWVTLFGALACFWVVHGLRVALGAARLPWLRDFSPAEDANCPALSIIFAARDEEEKLRAALETLVALDYPRLEIVAVNDRSSDSTGRIVDEFAARDEEEKLRAALETLVALDYPRLEIVAVNDRSSDSTGRIVDEFAAR